MAPRNGRKLLHQEVFGAGIGREEESAPRVSSKGAQDAGAQAVSPLS